MRTLKKVFAVLGLSVSLTACHGAAGMNLFDIPEEFDSSAKYEIVFWAKNDTNKTQTRIYENAISSFEKLYPNINVTMKLYTDYGKIYNDVITNIATNTTPNVCITYPDHIATYMTGANTVIPLDNLAADEKYGLGGSELLFDGPSEEEVVPQFLEECRINGQLFALPYMRSTEAVYINKDFVEKLGYEVPDILTWDFMFEVAEAATKKDSSGKYEINGQNVMIPIIYKSTDNMMIQMLKQKGAGYSDENGTVEIFNDTTKELLYMVAEHSGSGAFSTFKISSYPANFLNAGQCIFAIDSTAGSTWMGSDAPLLDISADKLVQFETEIRPVPQFDTENPYMISQGPSVCIFNKDNPQEVLASWLFAQYLLTDEVQIAYSETEGYLPVTSKAQNTPEYQEYLSLEGSDNADHYKIKIQASKLLMKYTENTFVTPVFNGSTSLRDAAGQMIENTVKSVRRKETVDDAYMEQLFSDVSSLYHLDQISAAGSAGAAKDLGPLPKESRALLYILVITWIILGSVYFWKKKNKRNKAES